MKNEPECRGDEAPRPEVTGEPPAFLFYLPSALPFVLLLRGLRRSLAVPPLRGLAEKTYLHNGGCSEWALPGGNVHFTHIFMCGNNTVFPGATCALLHCTHVGVHMFFAQSHEGHGDPMREGMESPRKGPPARPRDGQGWAGLQDHSAAATATAPGECPRRTGCAGASALTLGLVALCVCCAGGAALSILGGQASWSLPTRCQ